MSSWCSNVPSTVQSELIHNDSSKPGQVLTGLAPTNFLIVCMVKSHQRIQEMTANQ